VVGNPSGIGQVKRDLGELIQALGVVGGGGSPNELRSDAGIMVQVGVEETLSRHVDLLTQEHIRVSIGVAASTTATSAFSFDEDVYVQNIGVFGTVTPANLEGSWLTITNPAIATRGLIYLTLPANELIFVGGMVILMGGDNVLSFNENVAGVALPLFVRAGSDFNYSVRADAVGGVTMVLMITVTRTPKGVPIPH